MAWAGDGLKTAIQAICISMGLGVYCLGYLNIIKVYNVGKCCNVMVPLQGGGR